MPMRSRTGPFTISTGEPPIVVAPAPCSPKRSSAIASTPARTVGKYSGLQPAMTALIATFSTLSGARFGGSTAISSSGSRRVAASIRSTRAGVGGTTGSPSVTP